MQGEYVGKLIETERAFDNVIKTEIEKIPPVIRFVEDPDAKTGRVVAAIDCDSGRIYRSEGGALGISTSPPPPESVLQEAHRLTHGPRQADYSHPLDDYTRTAGIVNALFAHKLKEPLLPEEVTLIMCAVKLSRQVHKPKRDNMVDAAGYAWCTDAIIEERKRRAAK